MATKAQKTAAAAARCEARITERLGGDKAGNVVLIMTIFELIMKFVAACQENKAERLTKRIAKSRGMRQAIMANRAYRQADGDLTRKQCRDGVAALVEEARENPKDTAAMLRECQTEMEDE